MTAIGALIGLVLAIVLIIRKVSPVYSLILGALVGGLAGGVSLPDTVSLMIGGVNDITPAVIRILTAGVLTGVLVKTGAAEAISLAIIRTLGRRHVHLALALATMLLTAIGVFIDVAVITVAPIALTIGRKLQVSRTTLLLMMIGGGKCGNIISPNPNTIVCAENFGADLYSVMYANLLPAVLGLLFTVYIVGRLLPKGVIVSSGDVSGTPDADDSRSLPSPLAALSGPILTIALLALRPLAGIAIDPMIALPAGGIFGITVMRKWRMMGDSLSYGLSKMSSVSLLLIATGTIAGIIKASTIKDLILAGLQHTGFGEVALAPVSGALMSAATASTTAGATVASSSFAQTILAAGISGIWGAAMINAGATVVDHLPHGSFFHATGGVTEMDIASRLRLIPYETAVGLFLALASVGTYYLAALF